MAKSAGGIKAGKAYVEASLEDSKLARGLKMAQARMKAFAAGVQSISHRLLGLGTAAAAPFALAVKSGADFQSQMADLANAANPTTDELVRIRKAAMQMSRELGVGPEQAASAMTELLKAGMPLETVLGGAAQSAIQFARVGEMDVAQAATVMADAMNVFVAQGYSAAQAADVISKAADASSISIEEVAQAFAQGGAVAALARQNMDDVATAIAIMGQNGVKGSDAGTSLKTMLTALMAPSSEGAGIMRKYGLQVRDASGEMKDMRGIVAELQDKLGGLSDAQRDAALKALLGSDAIRAGAILMKGGVKGWDEFAGKMEEGLSVSQKYANSMNTFWGILQRLQAGLQRIAVTLFSAVGPALSGGGGYVDRLITAVETWAEANGDAIRTVAAVAAAVIGAGVALMALSVTVKVAAFAVGGLTATLGVAKSLLMILPAAVQMVGTAIRGLTAVVMAAKTALLALLAPVALAKALLLALLSPVALVTAAVVGLIAYLVTSTDVAAKALGWLGSAFNSLKQDAITAWSGIAGAIKAGDLGLAAKIAMTLLKMEVTRGLSFLKGLWTRVWTGLQRILTDSFYNAAIGLNNAWAGMETAWLETTDALADAWTWFSSGVLSAWHTVTAGVKKQWAKFKAWLSGEDATVEVNRIDEELEQKRTANDDAMSKEILERESARTARREQIERDRTGTNDVLANEADAADRKLVEERDDELARLTKEFQDAQQAFRDLAKRGHEAGEPAGKADPGAGAVAGLATSAKTPGSTEDLMEKLKLGAATVETKRESVGAAGFRSSAAASAIARAANSFRNPGQKKDDPQEKTAEEVKKVADGVGALVQKIDATNGLMSRIESNTRDQGETATMGG